MKDFVHLHAHTEFSLLDGLGKITEYFARCKEFDMKSMAITDHGSMYGVIKFYLKAKEAGIKPLIGCETYLAKRSRFDKEANVDIEPSHLILICENQTGYKNLIKLISLAHLEGYYYKPRIDLEVLDKYHEGLIATSACLAGQISRYLMQAEEAKAKESALKFAEIFGKDRFYLELQDHPRIKEQKEVNTKIIELARKTGLPLVATNDSHYVNPDDAEAQEVLLCLQTKRFLSEKNRPLSMIDSPDFYLKSPKEMEASFQEYPEALNNTVKIAEMANLEIELGRWILPEFPIPEGETYDSYLKKTCYERISNRFQRIDDEVKNRLEYELDIISQKKYSAYFLVVADLINWAKEQKIQVGPGRGSGAGSLVAYILRITELNPLEHKLPFERFLNPSRPTPPDFDLDFADDRRDEVIKYVTEKYGNDKVAQIITFGTMEARQAVRDVGRVLGLPYSIPDRIAKLIPLGAQGFPMTIDKALEITPELKVIYDSDPETQRLLNLAKKLEGVARHASTHAAGVVIADKPLTEYTPLQKETKGDRIITQYDMYDLDLNVSDHALGLLKMDFLGLRNLTILQEAIKLLSAKGIEIELSKIPLEDKGVYKMIASGDTTGVFQLESAGMRRLARDLVPTKFTDIAAMVALFRPGPMEVIPLFIEGKKNPAKVKYIHNDLKQVLAETYGVPVFQEQCMQIANVMAGYSLSEADNLRRAIGKKKPELMKKEKVKFIKGCVEKGYNESVAENVWGFIEKFVGYGFNRAHSASYALIAYWTAYMKYHYPYEFIAAMLSAESRGTSGPQRDEKIALVLSECRRMEIKVLPPDINRSKSDFTIEEKAIRFGLSAIKNVGSAATDVILNEREKGDFKTMGDFLGRVDPQKVNKKTLESLIKAGALDRFGKRSALLSAVDKMLEESHKRQKQNSSGQTSLFGGMDKEDDPVSISFQIPDIEEFSRNELLAFEKELLGFYITEHPMSRLLEEMEEFVEEKIGRINEDEHNERVITIGGVVTETRKILTKNKNQEMIFAKIEDITGAIEVVVFPKLYADTKNLWANDKGLIVTGRIEFANGRSAIIAEKINDLQDTNLTKKANAFNNQTNNKVEIAIPRGTDTETLKKIHEILRENPGTTEMTLIIPNGETGPKKIKVPFGVAYDKGLEEKIKNILERKNPDQI